LKKYRPLFLTAILFTGVTLLASAQDILTASKYFDTVSQKYSSFNDYIADISMQTPEAQMAGTLYYRKPGMIRLDFTKPEKQVLVSDGKELMIYVPHYNVVLQQELRANAQGSGASLATAAGLQLMKTNYSIAYLNSPDPVPLEDGSDEMVTRLRLDWRSTNEGFRQLILSIDSDKLIRRIVGVTVNYNEIQFDFKNIRLNQNIPTARFEYDPPASANSYSNFLFEQEG